MKDKQTEVASLRAECAGLARESVQRALALARLEAEVMALRERCAVHPIAKRPPDGATFLAWYPETQIPMWAITCHDGTSLCGNALDEAGHEATHWLPMPGPIVTVVVEPAAEGGYSSFVPGVPGANSQGETAEDAERNALEALRELQAYRQEKIAGAHE